MLRWITLARTGALLALAMGVLSTERPARASWILNHSWTEELPLIVQAEELEERHGNFTVTSNAISHDWEQGDWAKYHMNVTSSGTYFAIINASSFYPTTYCKLGIYRGSSEIALATIDVPQTGSPMAWEESDPVSFDLLPGNYFIRVENSGNLAYAWDYMKLWTVPEPAAVAVILMGGALLAIRRRA